VRSFLQKDGVRPGEPGYDPRTLYIPKKAWNDFSPFEKQVREMFFVSAAHDRTPITVLGNQAKSLRYRCVLYADLPQILELTR
jgi:hypothetical protein